MKTNNCIPNLPVQLLPDFKMLFSLSFVQRSFIRMTILITHVHNVISYKITIEYYFDSCLKLRANVTF